MESSKIKCGPAEFGFETIDQFATRNHIRDVVRNCAKPWKELVGELPIKIKQRHLKMFCSKLKQRSAIEGTELNDCISSKCDDKLRKFFNKERQMRKNLKNKPIKYLMKHTVQIMMVMTWMEITN